MGSYKELCSICEEEKWIRFECIICIFPICEECREDCVEDTCDNCLNLIII